MEKHQLIAVAFIVLCLGVNLAVCKSSYKGMLQGYCQEKGLPLPEYKRKSDQTGQAYYSFVTVEKHDYRSKSAHENAKQADEDAAFVALDALGQIVKSEL